MKCEAEGKILVELPSTGGVTRDGKDREKREYIMETSERYHSKMRFSVCSFDGPVENPPKVGDKIRVNFTVEAREYKGNWYNEVRAHRTENINQ